MFFLFGSYVLRRTVDRGRFWCPTCLRETEYTLRRGRWFIHLFFIPLIPLAAAPEQVRCEECHAAYPPAVLLGGRAMSVEHAVPGPSLDPTRRSVSPGPGPTVDGEAVLAARAVVVGVLSLAPVVSHPGMRAGVDLVRSTGSGPTTWITSVPISRNSMPRCSRECWNGDAARGGCTRSRPGCW